MNKYLLLFSFSLCSCEGYYSNPQMLKSFNSELAASQEKWTTQAGYIAHHFAERYGYIISEEIVLKWNTYYVIEEFSSINSKNTFHKIKSKMKKDATWEILSVETL